jgi:exonuclease SbcC
MIPLTLALHNFMPYRDPAPLDFSGIHIACLAGDNGAGKSALLDAMTWALWGKARARRDDELIHQGQTEMSVEFTFALAGNTYRVVRQRKAGSRGAGALDLQVQTPEGSFRTLAEPTMRETQNKITSLLKLDYDTFINSSVLLQNRADEFTVKTPAERKQVLADILGLEQWTIYEERAKERIRNVEEQIRFVDARLKEIEVEIARRPEYEVELREAQSVALEMADALRQAEAALVQLQQVVLELRSLEAQAADLDVHIAQAKSELDRIARDRSEVQQRLEEFRRALDEREFIVAGYASLKAARAANDALGVKLGQLVQLNERKNRLEAAITDERRALEIQAQLAGQTLADLEARLSDMSLETELAELQKQAQTLQALAQEAQAIRIRRDELNRDGAERRAQNNALKRDMDMLQSRIAAIQSVGAVCPTCGRALGDDERMQLLNEWQTMGKTMGDTWRANKVTVEQAMSRQSELEASIAQAEVDARQLPALDKQMATLEARYAAAIDAAAVIEDRRATHVALQTRLAQQDYAHDEQSELGRVLGELAALGYDANEHQRLRDEIARLAEFEQRKSQLDSAQSGIADAEGRLTALAEAEMRWISALETDHTRRAEMDTQASALRVQLAEAPRVRQQADEARSRERIARERVGAARQKLAACEALAHQKQTRLDERDTLAEDQGLYEDLRMAFGKKGVPALIIEAAIPEIEDEANALLSRITAGRMHVRFDTQRETVKGEAVETLDIKIADELGTRPYENFSGGEQFRVNFAIRIALSKLLARRAGAQLQTLVMDEGFGQLDASGRERLVEAINAIQHDFSCILVITHVEELRDAFPARIEVTKTPQGSQVNIV